MDPSGARRWIVRVTVKGQKNRQGKPLRTDLGLGGANLVTLQEARLKALEYRRLAREGLNPRYNAEKAVPTFEEVAQQVHVERMPTWKNEKHGQQWINTLRDYAFPIIGRLPVDKIRQPEVLACLTPIWAEKHETAKRVRQRIRVVLDVAKSKGYRHGDNPVSEIMAADALPKVRANPKHHPAMPWSEVPDFYRSLCKCSSMAAKALQFTCLSASRTNGREVRTKNSKTFEAWFFPVDAMYRECFESWVTYLRKERLYGPGDALFPKVEIKAENGRFNATGLCREPYSNGQKINQIFKGAFTNAGLQAFSAHTVRKTLGMYMNDVCKLPEQFKAWSQNLGHEHFSTTCIAYMPISRERQREIISGLRT